MPAGIPPSRLPGPFPVGEYAAALRSQLRSFARVQLVGELVNLRPSRARVYFELRDATGAVPCAAWRQDWDQMVARAGAPQEGMQVVVGGGCDYYPGSATSSPGFSFTVLTSGLPARWRAVYAILRTGQRVRLPCTARSGRAGTAAVAAIAEALTATLRDHS